MKKLGSFLMNMSLWRPGVRLMQRLRFPAKMALIFVAFLLPLAWVLTAYITTKWEGIHYVQRERDGVRYVEAIYPTLEAAGLWRIQALMAATGEPGAGGRVGFRGQRVAGQLQAAVQRPRLLTVDDSADGGARAARPCGARRGARAGGRAGRGG